MIFFYLLVIFTALKGEIMDQKGFTVNELLVAVTFVFVIVVSGYAIYKVFNLMDRAADALEYEMKEAKKLERQ